VKLLDERRQALEAEKGLRQRMTMQLRDTEEENLQLRSLLNLVLLAKIAN
jgi:hypothetical protein